MTNTLDQSWVHFKSKEKAIELFKMFESVVLQKISGLDSKGYPLHKDDFLTEEAGKYCAITCIDEMIKFLNDDKLKNISFLNDVKKELEKM